MPSQKEPPLMATILGRGNSVRRQRIASRPSIPGMKSTLEQNLLHLLTHETAHLIATARPELHPDFKYRNKEIPVSEFQKWVKPGQPVTDGFPFLNFSWDLTPTMMPDKSEAAYFANLRVSPAMTDIFKRKKIHFYGTDPAAKCKADMTRSPGI